MILPHDPQRDTILLVSQFRYPAYVTGHKEALIEACAGLLDEDDPETCIRREAEEELGYKLDKVRLLYMPYMSPGSVTERLAFFTAQYLLADRISDGGGHAEEGEDIEVMEVTLDTAVAMIAGRPHHRRQDDHARPATRHGTRAQRRVISRVATSAASPAGRQGGRSRRRRRAARQAWSCSHP